MPDSEELKLMHMVTRDNFHYIEKKHMPNIALNRVKSPDEVTCSDISLDGSIVVTGHDTGVLITHQYQENRKFEVEHDESVIVPSDFVIPKSVLKRCLPQNQTIDPEKSFEESKRKVFEDVR